ncbi:hypothetical protein D5018_12335 [Parashewanella curva]|uniref:Uncharacterized protein n=1 Tax=Parashewanella curva TaxID=2338552 RepID=A0A3L8PVR5_9GAMM|nr:hypothetical protein [Parashewanella curva]RLV59414.1 hypothetical protein D5018_12335 [Parashewanella curva]
MRLQIFTCSVVLSLTTPAMALPTLSEPNDIVPVYQNIVEILNTKDNSILECAVIEGKLQDCQSKNVAGLDAPYRAVAAAGTTQTQMVYVAEKGEAGLFGFQTGKDGRIALDTAATDVPAFPYDPYFNKEGQILDIRRSSFNHSGYQNVYVSRGFLGDPTSYGKFSRLSLSGEQAKITNLTDYGGVFLPVFSVTQSEGNEFDDIIGAGQYWGYSSLTSPRYPLSGLIKKNGLFKEKNVSGGSAKTVKTILDPDIASIAQFNDKYWITYKSQRKFTRFDTFPSGAAVDENSYDAPNNSNVELKSVQTRTGDKTEVNNYALFADDNKIGNCTGESDFECTDAFRYLGINALFDDTDISDKSSVNATSLGDQGVIIFYNLNYSPINASEVTRQITIPESLKSAIKGSCLSKVDFAEKPNGNSYDENFACELFYDFRELSNTPPINESFDVGFVVHGPFGDVPTTFTFNVDLPTNIPHLQFEHNGTALDQLNLNAGDTGFVDVAYISDQSDTISPNISFLNGTDNSSLFRSYFTDTGCLSSNAQPLKPGEKCTLSYHIPANVNSVNYTINLHNPDGVPADAGVLPVALSSQGNIIAHSPYGNQSIEHLSSLHWLNIHSGGTEIVRFTNVGAAAVHNFDVYFVQPKDKHIPILLSGSCVDDPTLVMEALGGQCDLVIKLNTSASNISGRFSLYVLGNAINSYSIPITINDFPHDKGLAVVDSNTGALGKIELNQMANGYLTLTNYTGYPITDLSMSFPLKLAIFYYVGDKDNTIDCLSDNSPNQTMITTLAPLASCRLYYHVPSSFSAELQDQELNFHYTDTNSSIEKHEEESIHFTNQPALRVSEPSVDSSFSSVNLDASVPQTTVIFTNELNYNINNLSLSFDSALNGITSKNSCQNKPLGSSETCSVTITLDDKKALIGKYHIGMKADNLETKSIPLNINTAQTDTVEIDNRGGYSMSIDYTKYYPNTDGKDSHCQSGACYALASTGWFTNPFNSTITGVSGRKLMMYMMAGTSVQLPSCDGGKIVCTGTTLTPSCKYVGDGTNNLGDAQNHCLQYNPK